MPIKILFLLFLLWSLCFAFDTLSLLLSSTGHDCFIDPDGRNDFASALQSGSLYGYAFECDMTDENARLAITEGEGNNDCGGVYQMMSEPAPFSRLGSIGYDAIFSNQTSLFEVELTRGFITRVTVLRSVDYTRYTMKMAAMKREGEEAALDWFMNGPCAIYRHQENIPELVNLYTNGINPK